MSPVLSSDNGLQSSDEEADEVPHQTYCTNQYRVNMIHLQKQIVQVKKNLQKEKVR